MHSIMHAYVPISWDAVKAIFRGKFIVLNVYI